jgi:hypothetical protein
LEILSYNEIGFDIFFSINISANEAVANAKSIGDFLRRNAVANAVYYKTSLYVGIVVIIGMYNIEFSRPKKICKSLRDMRVARAIQYIDLNSLAFTNEHIGMVDFPADWMRKESPRNKFPNKQRNKQSYYGNERPGEDLQSNTFSSLALALAGAYDSVEKTAFCQSSMNVHCRRSGER